MKIARWGHKQATEAYHGAKRQKDKIVSNNTRSDSVEKTNDDITIENWKEKAFDKKIDFGNIKGVRFEKKVDKTVINQNQIEEIKDTTSNLSREYNIKLDSFVIGDYTNEEYIQSPMFYRSDLENGKYIGKLVINNACEFWYNDKKQKRVFESGYFAGTTLKDFVEHELAHVMTFQNCNTLDDYFVLEKELRPLYLNGVSRYSWNCKDGTETIAESFVKKGIKVK